MWQRPPTVKVHLTEGVEYNTCVSRCYIVRWPSHRSSGQVGCFQGAPFSRSLRISPRQLCQSWFHLIIVLACEILSVVIFNSAFQIFSCAFYSLSILLFLFHACLAAFSSLILGITFPNLNLLTTLKNLKSMIRILCWT